MILIFFKTIRTILTVAYILLFESVEVAYSKDVCNIIVNKKLKCRNDRSSSNTVFLQNKNVYVCVFCLLRVQAPILETMS